jgi:undecaprenyl-diphosphatase
MDQSITQWLNSFTGSNAIFGRIMIVASEFGVPRLIILVGLQ